MGDFTFYEFFAGGGMARAGLGSKWTCLFANDNDAKKSAAYACNWGLGEIHIGDVSGLRVAQIPGAADLAWASFPCQDLSLAGAGAGLKGRRSGTFWPFWALVKGLIRQNRAPKILVLENVCGAITSHQGRDFRAISSALSAAGYRFGAVVIDAVDFLPQSRPRLFIVGIRKHIHIPQKLRSDGPIGKWHSPSIVEAHLALSEVCKKRWIWWRLPQRNRSVLTLADILEENPADVDWNGAAETRKIVSMMNALHRSKVSAAQQSGRRIVGTLYKRMRDEGGKNKTQRAEVRFDNVAGCLRTPSGGASRQLIFVVKRRSIYSRLMSARETARLMGLPDSFQLPRNYYDAYHLTSDGVAVPVVRFLARNLLEPLLNGEAVTRLRRKKEVSRSARLGVSK